MVCPIPINQSVVDLFHFFSLFCVRASSLNGELIVIQNSKAKVMNYSENWVDCYIQEPSWEMKESIFFFSISDVWCWRFLLCSWDKNERFKFDWCWRYKNRWIAIGLIRKENWTKSFIIQSVWIRSLVDWPFFHMYGWFPLQGRKLWSHPLNHFSWQSWLSFNWTFHWTLLNVSIVRS